jgi:actin cytoskeleton-regulatory complex protein SLA1
LADSLSSVASRDTARPSSRRPDADQEKTRRSGVSVHFSDASPDIIPRRDSGEYDEYETTDVKSDEAVVEGEDAVVLYDFNADGDDELTVREGERLIVIERDGDEWWKCRNSDGAEGVVPASYVEVSSPICHLMLVAEPNLNS